MSNPSKEDDLAEECGEAGDQDEEESDGEETAEKSFVVGEDSARSRFQSFRHPQCGGEEGGDEGD